MAKSILLKIDGEVSAPTELSYEDLAEIGAAHQVQNVARYGAKRNGDAITLRGLLELAQVKDSASYLGIHSNTDNFHASIPLAPVLDRGLLIYRSETGPLQADAGGPLRFFVPEHAACRTDEIDACANVKFVEHLELTASMGFDNRRSDDEQNARLHAE